MDWLLFAVLFGAVVFVHELGHFLLAKRAGVFVERFALGFGPPVLKRKWGETEYCICLLPLGGYVKMRGEEPTGEAVSDPKSFAMKSPAVRMAIAAMGPTANLLLPILLFTSIYMAGMPTLTTLVGSVIPGSPADKAGLRPGDRIVAVEEEPLWKWGDLVERIQSRPGQTTRLKVERQGQTLPLNVLPVAGNEANMFGETASVGKIGIAPTPFRPVIGIANPSSPATKAGLQTGDIITAINGRKVDHSWQAKELFEEAKTAKEITVSRYDATWYNCEKERFEENDAIHRKEIKVAFSPKIKTLDRAGIEEGELYLRTVCPGTVAAEKKLQPGDKLLSLNGVDLENWSQFQTQVRENRGEPIVVGILRKNQILHFELVPGETVQQDELTREKRKIRKLGVASVSVAADPEIREERYLNPLTALVAGFRKTLLEIGHTAQGLSKVFTGKVALSKSLGGPITIFYLASDSYRLGGWINFVQMMAMLSITLGLINLLPVPVLDGGHVFFCAVEWIKGSPVSLKVREIAQHVGLVILIGLILLTFYVDINRYFIDRIRAFFN